MSLVEEVVVGFDAYKTRLDELEKHAPKERVVFIFEGGNKADGANWDAASNDMVQMLDELKKDVKGILIRVKVPEAEWKNPECKFKTDGKFKVSSLPYAAVFNQKLTVGRSWIHKKIEGDRIKNMERMKDLFK